MSRLKDNLEEKTYIIEVEH